MTSERPHAVGRPVGAATVGHGTVGHGTVGHGTVGHGTASAAGAGHVTASVGAALRRAGLGVVLGTVTAVSVAGAAFGASSAPGAVPPTGFGGYSWWGGPVHQVSARWRVPTIRASSGVGHASTWIGAQSAAGGYPFLQVGVTEDASGPGHDAYHAFWSDTAAGFHPQYMGALRAGDLVAVEMARTGESWRLSVDDLSRHRSLAKRVRYGAGAAFTQAEWLQEDPTAAPSVALDLPYPAMSDEAFSQVKVNSSTPRLALANAQSLMATGGTILVPTSFRHDEFAMVAPTGAGKQYLSDVAPLDFAINTYNFEMARWGTRPPATKVSTVRALVHAYAVFADRLVAQDWPPTARTDIAMLASDDTRLNADLVAWQLSGLGRDTSEFVKLEDDQDNNLGQVVRQSLGLPRV